MDNNIKDYREKELKNYTFGNILLVLLATGLLDTFVRFTTESSIWVAINALINSAIFSAVLYIYIFIIDSIVPSSWKDRIVWLRKGKPGSHIFSQIKTKNKDSRFTFEQANEAYAEIYNKMNGKSGNELKNIENSAWYRIYKTCEEKPQIWVSQRDYLLCRDMTIMTIIVLIGYICLQVYLKQCISFSFILVLVAEFIVNWFSARNKGTRFAYNVLAVDLAQKKKEENSTQLLLP